MSLAALCGSQGCISSVSEGASSESALGTELLGWFLTSSLGGLMSMRVSLLELISVCRAESSALVGVESLSWAESVVGRYGRRTKPAIRRTHRRNFIALFY